jgi:hypothetical protein
MDLFINNVKDDFFDISIDIEKDKIYEMELSVVNDKGKKIFPLGKTISVKKKNNEDRLELRFSGSKGPSLYRINLKIFSDGQLQFIGSKKVELNSSNQEESYGIIKNPFFLAESKEVTENEYDKFYVVRNMTYSWRKETDCTVSIYDPMGNLTFLHDTMIKVWNQCDGNTTVLGISSNTGINVKTAVKAVSILANAGMVRIFIKD